MPILTIESKKAGLANVAEYRASSQKNIVALIEGFLHCGVFEKIENKRRYSLEQQGTLYSLTPARDYRVDHQPGPRGGEFANIHIQAGTNSFGAVLLQRNQWFLIGRLREAFRISLYSGFCLKLTQDATEDDPKTKFVIDPELESIREKFHT